MWILAASITLFIVIPIIAVIFLSLTRQPEASEELESHPEHEVPVMIFENSWELNNFIGLETPFESLMSAIATEVIKPSEIETAPMTNDTEGLAENNYLVNFTESSIEYIPEKLPITLSFDISVSDGRSYIVYVYVNGRNVERFLTTIIQRTDKINENNSAYIFFTNETQLSNIDRWLEDIAINHTVVIREQLTVS